ncbi:2,3,4,5-tetrahydropyridine-2,6-dicarboxylate N-succinyltransferase [Myxococcota bacterium]|nr:2,3,4,5-tetrahydropyridine-2,6-dicarboxylate N-succinyltransferase [Myxococcota bacterium]MBU1429923.1 2,3,4,5-tetrahydropyridine-2,6-dicarboxylate N-succinyltransferase [Myxococcota bacterium]
MDPRQAPIEAAFAGELPLDDAAEAVHALILSLDRGEIRVATPAEGGWIVHEWVKKGILLAFRLAEMEVIEIGPFEYHDKIPPKVNLARAGIRVVPPGVARLGSFLEPGVILMPGYVNIGAWVGAGSMIDTWATVGSCAQIGRGVHLSGGVGIGGVLEPPSATPVIIEDGAFIGSRAVIVEGVRVGQEAVIGANVVLTASTPIIDVSGPQEVIHRGVVPPRAVVIPGVRPKVFPAGTYHVPCALIIGQRKESTDRKTSLNDALRGFDVQV